MKWSFLLVLAALALAGCSNSGPRASSGHHDSVRAGVIHVPGYSAEVVQ